MHALHLLSVAEASEMAQGCSGGVSAAQAKELMSQAYDAGVNFFDK